MGDMQAAGTFYQVMSQVSFTLLGLWFVVLGLAQRDWNDPLRHRERLHIALFFLLPGTTGLIAVLGGSNATVWRWIFVLGAVVGIVESMLLLTRRQGLRGTVELVLHVVAPAAYMLVGLAAFVPRPALGLAPLQIEGFAVSLVFLLGVVHLWRVFAERPVRDAPPLR